MFSSSIRERGNSQRTWRRGGRDVYRGTSGHVSSASALPSPLETQVKLAVIREVLAGSSIGNETLKATDMSYVASYNWTESSSPEILVPGKPPKWQPLLHAQRLRRDNGTYYRDKNAARFPTFSLEPAVQAVLRQSQDEQVFDVDVFGCGNTLGCLMSFVQEEDRTFRFGIERVGRMMMLVRKPNHPRETIDDVYGYGHSFPEAYTTWEASVKGSVSHQRIIRYTFGGLKFLVRSECDGYLPAVQAASRDVTSDSVLESLTADINTTEDAELSLSSLLVQPRAPASTGHLLTRSAGSVVSQESIFDLKTRSIRTIGQVSVTAFLQRLWISQTPHLVLAFHEQGEFKPSDIQIHPVTQVLQDWERDNADVLAKYRGILSELILLSSQDGKARLEVRRIGKGSLEVWSETESWAALPDKLRAKCKAVQDMGSFDDDDGGASTCGDQYDGDSDEGDDADYLKF